PRAITTGSASVTHDGAGDWTAVFTAESGRPDLLPDGEVCRLQLDDNEPMPAIVAVNLGTTIRLMSPGT
ncbi:MAG TPA: hypothetical protein VGM93_04980, partial [Acidimicrobiales bacterium]